MIVAASGLPVTVPLVLLMLFGVGCAIWGRA